MAFPEHNPERGLAIAGITIGSYIFLAVVLVRIFPLWPRSGSEGITKKRRIKFPTRRVGHRGGSMDGPENTMWTFKRTAPVLDIIELDVALLHDDEIVVTHDHDLGRQCHYPGAPKHIDEVSSSALPLLGSNIKLHFTAPDQEAYHLAGTNDPKAAEMGLCTEQQPYCLLKDVFSEFKNKPIHLDMKYTSDDLVVKVMDMIDQFDRRQLTIIGAASGPNVKKIRSEIDRREKMEQQQGSAKGHYLTFASFPEVAVTYVCYYLGILPFVPRPFDCFSIPFATNVIKDRMRKGIKLNFLIKEFALWALNSQAMWKHLQRRGIVVLGFVINSPEEWEEVVEWEGTDGIMTDCPLLMNEFLKCHDSGTKFTTTLAEAYGRTGNVGQAKSVSIPQGAPPPLQREGDGEVGSKGGAGGFDNLRDNKTEKDDDDDIKTPLNGGGGGSPSSAMNGSQVHQRRTPRSSNPVTPGTPGGNKQPSYGATASGAADL